MCGVCFRVRHCEFAKAAASCILDNSIPQLHYLGFVRKDYYSKIHTSLSSVVYEYWDTLAEAGPQTRPRETQGSEQVGLKVLAMTAGGAVSWPPALFEKFGEGTAERHALDKKKEAFVGQYPESLSESAPRSSRQSEPPRSTARPDFSIDGGATPLDTTRCVDLAGVKASDFTAKRLPASRSFQHRLSGPNSNK